MAKTYRYVCGKVTEDMKEEIRTLAGYGFNVEQIAWLSGVSAHRIRRRHMHDVELGSNTVHKLVIDKLLDKIREGNITAIMFWLKCRAGWSENPSPAATAIQAVYVGTPPAESREQWLDRKAKEIEELRATTSR